MTADPVLPGDTLHQHHYSAKEGNMRPSFIIAVCVAAFLAACQSVPVTADYAKTYGEAYAKGFEDGFNKAKTLNTGGGVYGNLYNDPYYGDYGTVDKESLAYAVQKNDLKKVKELVDGGRAVDELDPSGYTPLQLAARSGFQPMVEYLLSKGAEVNFQSSDGYTPLKEAVTYRKAAMAEMLIAKGADINFVDTSGASILYYAAQAGDQTLVKLLLSKKVALEQKTVAGGWTPFLIAASYGFHPIVTLLAEAGADVNARETTSGKTALFYLIPSGNVTTIKLLLDKGAKIDMSDNAGDTPLLLAKRLGQQAVIDLLEQKNAKPM